MEFLKSRKTWLYAAIVAVLLLLTFIIIKNLKPRDVIVDPEFSRYISAYSSGVISVESHIRIQLAAEINQIVELNTPIDKKLFSFSPSVKGDAVWIDNRTIEFRPEKKLKQGATYTVDFYLSKLMEVPKKFRTFTFQFQTLTQHFAVGVTSFKPYDNNNLKLYFMKGIVQTADVVDEQEFEKIFSAVESGKKLSFHWEFHKEREHGFVIDSIERKEKADSVILSWDGSLLDVEEKGEKTYAVPALGDFSVIETSVIQQPEQHLMVRFSDPLDRSQNLDGLIRLEGAGTLSFTIDDNEVSVFPAVRQSGSLTLTVEQGIRNVMGYKFPKTVLIPVTFESMKPAIRLTGKGVILPSSEGLVLPFQSVNIKAVDVKIIKIFENNIGFFLQANQLDGDNELKRSGRMIAKKTIQLSAGVSVDLGRWNTFSIDLSKLIEQEPGAIYHVELSFKKNYSVYPCADSEDDKTGRDEENTNSEEDYEREVSYWDGAESYYSDGYYDYGYDWDQREDPCSKSYYYGNKVKVARNLLASDLAIIAKGGNDKTIKFVVTDVRTTKPLSGVTLEVYDYQRQLLGSAETKGDGMADVYCDHKPYLLIAKNGKQRGYLRLDDGSSLSLSSFDVAGQIVQRGIKGYIYGERGVWRPGDTLYLNFIIEDKEEKLPKNHPVTLELINPLGQVVKKMIKTESMNGFYSFTTSTSSEAPTGDWTATVKAGGARFVKVIKIETVKPNRLKINLDFGVKMLSASNSNVSGKLNVKWLHGATAKNLRAQVMVKLVSVSTSFPKYEEYVFDDPARRFSGEEQSIFDSQTDEEGNASVSSSIEAGESPGMLKANFTVRAYEEGGDFSTDRFSIPYSPYDCYIGFRTPKGDQARGMLLTDTTHIVNVVTVDENGKPLSRQNIDVKIYKLNWQWWWDASDNELADYTSNNYHVPVFSGVLNTTNGKGNFSFKIKYPEWGRFLIRVSEKNGHAAGKIVYIDWPGWAGKARSEDPTGASMLSFTTDKSKYKVGEEAKVSFPASGEGRALVSIETGSKVLQAYWVEAKEDQKETSFSFKITADMSPNCYLHITYVQPHIRKSNELPIRLYGVVPILVDDDKTHLNPEIIMPDVLRSESIAKIKVREKNGKAMTYTLAMVDEGLLDLTRFKTPDPWGEFYAREALGVKTWDMYDWILGAYGGRIEQLFAIGGDDDLIGKEGKKANRFKPMVKVLGPFYLSGGSNEHKIQLPQYIGSVRVMVVAGNKGAYGNAEKAVPVRKPMMILATLPRVLGPGEEVKLPVTVFAMEKNIRTVKLQISGNDMFTFDENTKDISFSEPGDETVMFNIKVKSGIGVGKVKISAVSGSEKAQSDIEIEVRNPNPKLVESFESVLDPGKNWNTTVELKGMPGTNKATLEISNIPPIDFGRRLRYLIEYPHGCVEQTTSSVFPQLFLGDVVELDAALKAKTDANVKAGINRLSTFILSDGSLSYWPSETSPCNWGTTYAGHFLLEAEQKGYTLPNGFKSNWIKYQKKAARNWTKDQGSSPYYQEDLEQAYRLYTLALAGDPEMGAMNRLRSRNDLTVQARWRLAAAYALAGQEEAAKQLTEKITADVKPYSPFSSTYGSEERDWAMILETMSLMNDRTKAAPLAKKISERLRGEFWLSTQSTAYCLLGMSKFAKNNVNGQVSFTYSFNNGKQIKAATKLPVAQVSLDVATIKSGSLSVTNNSSGVLFARIVTEGLPETDNTTEFENNLHMTVKYQDMKGEDIDVSNIVQGTDFKAIVTVHNTSPYAELHEMTLNQIFPSGWEITTSRLSDEEVSSVSRPTYQNFRDDRVYTYFNLYSGKSQTYIVKLNAAYLGKFYLPALSCEAMYNSSISARKAGQWVEVTE